MKRIRKTSYCDWLKQKNIDFIEMPSESIADYQQAWFEHFVPPEQREEAINRCHCFDSDYGWDYLWHVFSYELLHRAEGEAAMGKLNTTHKARAVLLVNSDRVAFQIADASLLTAADINELDDVLLTDAGFSWTYAKTHESDLGPYFHQH